MPTQKLYDAIGVSRWNARNCDITGLAEAELGARLLIA
jgi:hypothetical protein